MIGLVLMFLVATRLISLSVDDAFVKLLMVQSLNLDLRHHSPLFKLLLFGLSAFRRLVTRNLYNWSNAAEEIVDFSLDWVSIVF